MGDLICYDTLPDIEEKEGDHAEFGKMLMEGLRKEGGIWVADGVWEENKISFKMEAQAAAGYAGSFWALSEAEKDASMEDINDQGQEGWGGWSDERFTRGKILERAINKLVEEGEVMVWKHKKGPLMIIPRAEDMEWGAAAEVTPWAVGEEYGKRQSADQLMRRLTQAGGRGIRVGENPKKVLQTMAEEEWEKVIAEFVNRNMGSVLAVPYVRLQYYTGGVSVVQLQTMSGDWVEPHTDVVRFDSEVRHPLAYSDQGWERLREELDQEDFKLFQVVNAVLIIGPDRWQQQADLQADTSIYEGWCPSAPLSEISKRQTEKEKMEVDIEEAEKKRKAEEGAKNTAAEDEMQEESEDGEGDTEGKGKKKAKKGERKKR